MKYNAKRTRHKWAEIYKYKSHTFMKKDDGLYYEFTGDQYGCFIKKKGYKDLDQCIEKTLESTKEFFNNNVIIDCDSDGNSDIEKAIKNAMGIS